MILRLDRFYFASAMAAAFALAVLPSPAAALKRSASSCLTRPSDRRPQDELIVELDLETSEILNDA